MDLKHFDVLSQNGQIHLNIKCDTLTNGTSWSMSLLNDLQVICEQDNVKSIDLQLPDNVDAELEDMSHLLARIVLKKTCYSVVVSDFHLLKVRGKVKGVIFQDVKRVLGDTIALEIGESILAIKDIISVSKFTDKIISKGLNSDFQEVINQLNSLTHNSDVPRLMTVTVVKAYKILRKARRNLNNEDSAEDIEKDKVAPTGRLSDYVTEDPMTDDKKSLNSLNEPQTKEKVSVMELENISASSSKSLKKNTKLSFKSHKKRGEKHNKERKCYVCKNCYCHRKKKDNVQENWKQYPRMCKPCAELNFQKRHQSTDLTGKYAVVTGGRIKIGYELVLKLLRDGCFVIVTTRFPHNASKSFAAEKDFEDWTDRLKIYGLDLKDIAGIYKFVKYIQRTVPHLDILINNAAQTLRRPMDFYRHLLDYECIPQSHLQEKQQPLLATSQTLNYNYYQQVQFGNSLPEAANLNTKPLVEEITEDEVENETKAPLETEKEEMYLSDHGQSETVETTKVETPTIEVLTSDGCEDTNEPPVKRMKFAPLKKAEMSNNGNIHFLQRSFSVDCQPVSDFQMMQRMSMPGAGVQMNDGITGRIPGSTSSVCLSQGEPSGGDRRSLVTGKRNAEMFNMQQYFPRGAMDDDGQQLDLRRTNSWMTVMEQVQVPELMDVMVVNAIAPFILNRDLKSLMVKSPAKRKFIVNVSAMEGQFSRAGKSKFHPHLNMAKAALNMMTRTTSLGYKDRGVYMTSVDAGRASDDRPVHLLRRAKNRNSCCLPLDSVDGAARIYDPVVMGLTQEEMPHFAVLLKDYEPYPW